MWWRHHYASHHCRYGGIQLGPDRFKHINNVARIIIQESGLGLEVRTYVIIGPLHFESTRVGSVTRVLMVQIQRFSDFLKA